MLNGVLWLTSSQSRVYCPLVPSGPEISSGSTLTLSRTKCWLKINDWMFVYLTLIYLSIYISYFSKVCVPRPASFSQWLSGQSGVRNGIALALLQGIAALKRVETLRCLLLWLHAIQADLLRRLCLHDKGLQRPMKAFPHTSQWALPCPKKQWMLSTACTIRSYLLLWRVLMYFLGDCC